MGQNATNHAVLKGLPQVSDGGRRQLGDGASQARDRDAARLLAIGLSTVAPRPRWESHGERVGGRLYYGAAKLGYELEFAGPVAAIVWLPAGVAIAFCP